MESGNYNPKLRFKDVPDVLAKIVQDKAITVEKLKSEVPLNTFINDLEPSQKSFHQALAKKNAGFILECKKASPSKGLIREDFNVKAIAQTYDKYAAAISVLTEDKYFQGSFDYLRTVTRSVSCPVLNKDFFFDTYQVYMARHFGADAILLMLSVLDDEQYTTLAKLAEQYKMDVLTEVSNEQERDRAVKLGAKIIGINNRNLRDLSTDLNQTFKLADGIPNDRLIISESGIYTNKQVRHLAQVADGFLVGSSVMAQADIDLACRKLIFGEHKVCGLTSPNDAKNVAESGATLGGLIFTNKSPRYVSMTQASEICEQVPSLEYVGVFVNQSIEEVAQAAENLKLSRVQLHGDESEDYIALLKERLTNNDCKVIKAQKVEDQLPQLVSGADGHLLDSTAPGSGQSFDWQSFDKDQQELSGAMLAGGLGPNNVSEAIKVCTQNNLSGMDFNSGVEVSPGIKDASKLKQVFTLIRSY